MTHLQRNSTSVVFQPHLQQFQYPLLPDSASFGPFAIDYCFWSNLQRPNYAVYCHLYVSRRLVKWRRELNQREGNHASIVYLASFSFEEPYDLQWVVVVKRKCFLIQKDHALCRYSLNSSSQTCNLKCGLVFNQPTSILLAVVSSWL